MGLADCMAISVRLSSRLTVLCFALVAASALSVASAYHDFFEDIDIESLLQADADHNQMLETRNEDTTAEANGMANACKSGVGKDGEECPADDSEGGCPEGCAPDENAPEDAPDCAPVTLNQESYMCAAMNKPGVSSTYNISNMSSVGRFTCAEGEPVPPSPDDVT